MSSPMRNAKEWRVVVIPPEQKEGKHVLSGAARWYEYPNEHAAILAMGKFVHLLSLQNRGGDVRVESRPAAPWTVVEGVTLEPNA